MNPLSGAAFLKLVDGKPRVSSMPYTYDIAEGNVANHVSWSKTGYNADVDVGVEDVWTYGWQYVFPAAEAGMRVVSSSENDAAAGTGIQKVYLVYLDDAGAEKTEIITMNGTTPVNTTATDIYRIQNFRAYQVGTGKVAAGDINIYHLTEATPIYSQIATSMARARNIVWTVPAGKVLFINHIFFSASGVVKSDAHTVLFTTMAKYDTASGRAIDFFMPYTELLLSDEARDIELLQPTKLIAGTDLKVQARGLTANCYCTTRLSGWLETA